MKISGVAVEECENFVRYSIFHCKGEHLCGNDPNCEYKRKKREEEKQKEKVEVEK